MKILQLITLSELGGAQSVVANLANELNGRGHEVVVAAGEGDGKLFQLLNKSIETTQLTSLVRRISPLKELKALLEMRRLYSKYHPDIVHLHSSKAGLLGRIAFPSRKVVYTVHGFDSIRVAFRKFLPLEKGLQKQAKAIVGVSKYDYDNMHSENLVHNVSFIYNGIPEPKQTLRDDPFSDLRRRYRRIVLCIARLAPPKNYELFLNCAAKMPEYAFVWIGNQQSPDFSLPENCFFKGNILSAGEYCRYADLFFLPSNYEGLPIVILEAMACHCPVVASNVGGIPELLNGKNGFAVDNNVESCTDAISTVLANRESFAAEAYRTYSEKFTIELMTDNYETIYRS